MTKQIQLHGRVFIQGEILALSGLHIGGSGGAFAIGGNDNPVIVNPLTAEPYIPGSSLRGKMRSLTEKYRGDKLVSHANVTMHTAEDAATYAKSPVANIYGVPAQEFNLPTRLIVRDVSLTAESREHLRKAKTDLPFTEVKTEVSIDRVTSQANPRNIERVPAGAVFGPMQLVYSIYQPQDIEWLAVLIDGMELLQDDYLGGSGSRGSGKIEFQNLSVTLKRSSEYRKPYRLNSETVNLAALIAGLADIQNAANHYIFGSA